MSRDDDPSELEQPATGTGTRVGVVLAILVAIVVLIWWVRPDRGRGEPEQAHRILIVGGTPTDLGAAIEEAGFESDQQTWSALEVEVLALADTHGSFDLDALLDYADEHGYGFVAVMLEDLPGGWARDLLGVEPPESAVAAVIAVGDLQAESGPTVRYGGPEPELEYAPGVRRSEGLRLALYEHPDLVRLWIDPSPEQLALQVELGKLDGARVLLDRASERRTTALGAWPKLPDDAITSVWEDVHGFPVPGGLVVERRPSSLRVNERREVERITGPSRTHLVSDSALAGPNPLEHATELAIDPPKRLLRSQSHRWIVGLARESERWHRYEATDTTVVDHGPVDAGHATPLAISDLGQVISGGVSLVADVGNAGPIEMIDLWVAAAEWIGPDSAIVGLYWTDPDVVGVYERYLLVLRFDPLGGPPTLTTLSPDSLLAAGSFVADSVEIVEFRATTAGLFVFVAYGTPSGDYVRSLVCIENPSAGPKPSLLAPANYFDQDLLRAAATDGAFELVEFGTPGSEISALDLEFAPSLGFAPDLEFAPDATWVAWRGNSPGEHNSIRVAPLTAAGFGPEVILADASSDRFVEVEAPDGPWFRADGRTLVFAETESTALALEPGDWDYLFDPWTAEYLRIVTLK